jgi:hypothetical protein
VATAAAIGSCVVAVAGCGGDNETSTSAATAVPGVTSPGQVNPGRDSNSTTQTAPGATTPSAPGITPFEAGTGEQALAPFRECLKQHDVDLSLLDDPAALRQRYQQDPGGFRAQIERGFACIPELPPPLRVYAERFKRRFEQRTKG